MNESTPTKPERQLPMLWLPAGASVSDAVSREAALADLTQQTRYITDHRGDVVEIKPNPHSPLARSA